MEMRTKWTVRVDGLQTLLAFGDTVAARQPVIMSLLIEGLAPEAPRCLGDCFDTAPVCDWITGEWPKSTPTPLVETRVNELLHYLFAYDKRVQSAWVGLYRSGLPQRAARVGIERKASRSQFQTRLRASKG